FGSSPGRAGSTQYPAETSNRDRSSSAVFELGVTSVRARSGDLTPHERERRVVAKADSFRTRPGDAEIMKEPFELGPGRRRRQPRGSRLRGSWRSGGTRVELSHDRDLDRVVNHVQKVLYRPYSRRVAPARKRRAETIVERAGAAGSPANLDVRAQNEHRPTP